MTLDVKLDRLSPVPLYFQLSQELERAITEGELKPGDRIETEVEIAERLGLSRPTVRQAIQDLVNKGMLVRRRGVGTQVVHSQLRRSMELTSLFDDLTSANKKPTTRVLSLGKAPADATVAAALNIAEGTSVIAVKRLRSVRNEPLAIMSNWLPADLVPLTKTELERTGLYDLLRSNGIQMRVANQRIGARSATAAEARLLDLKPNAPLLTMERTSFDESGKAVEYSSHCYRADAYSFETTLVAR